MTGTALLTTTLHITMIISNYQPNKQTANNQTNNNANNNHTLTTPITARTWQFLNDPQNRHPSSLRTESQTYRIVRDSEGAFAISWCLCHSLLNSSSTSSSSSSSRGLDAAIKHEEATSSPRSLVPGRSLWYLLCFSETSRQHAWTLFNLKINEQP